MKRYSLIALLLLGVTGLMAQQSDPIADGLGGVATIAGETESIEVPQDSANVTASDEQSAASAEVPVWRKKLYYGYNFDIYFHHDSRTDRKENGWSFTIEPEIGWKLKERIYLGLRVGGSFQDTYTTYTYELWDGSKKSENLRVRQGSWDVTPYVRYRMKTLFNDKVGIWLEAHVIAGMKFPSVASGSVQDTEYEGLKHGIFYGAQLAPVITYQFNRKSTFQVFFSILSVGYSGTTLRYVDPETHKRRNEYTNDVIIFSGKLSNLIANQFTPGLYGLKFGIQKNF